MIRLLLAILLLLPSLAWGQSSGVGGPYFKDDCTTIPAHVTNKILCWEQNTATLKTWNGSAWANISPVGTGDVTHTGTLDANFFITGNGLASIKSISLSGYVFGNAGSPPTASATIPTTDLAGALQAAQFPALTGDVTTVAGALATTLATSGATPGTYTKVTVDAKGRVTVGATANLATDVTGNLPVTNLNSGTGATGSTCWFGDGTWKACTAGAGGTVTNTGTLTASRLVVGNGGTDVKVLASLGTTTTVLHGNAAGLPTFGAVDLSADTTGSVPTTKGGTNVDSSGFTGLAKVTAGVWSAYGGSGPCTAGSFVTALSTLGVVTCTPGGVVTGSSAASRVTYWDSASSISGDALFTWSTSNKRLTVNSTTTSFTRELDVTNSDAAGRPLVFIGDTSARGIVLGHTNASGAANYGWVSYNGLNPTVGQGVIVTSTGLVAIGTVAPAFTFDVAAASKAARLSRLTLADATTGSSFELMANSYYDGADRYLTAGFAGRLEMLQANGAWRLQTADTSGAADAVATFTTKLFVTQLGLVGVNTTSLSTAWLDVVNTIPIGTARVASQRLSGAVTGAVITTTLSVEAGDGCSSATQSAGLCSTLGLAGVTFPIYVSGQFADFTNTLNASTTFANATAVNVIKNAVTIAAMGASGASGSVGQMVYSTYGGTAATGHLENYGGAFQSTINIGSSPDANFIGVAAQMFVKSTVGGTVQAATLQIVNTASVGGDVDGLEIKNGVDQTTTNLVRATDAIKVRARQGASGGVEGWVNAFHLKDDQAGGLSRFVVANTGIMSINASAVSAQQLLVASLTGDGNGSNLMLCNTGSANPCFRVLSLAGNWEIRNNGGSLIARISAAGEVTFPSYAGSGNDYACFDTNGALFRSNTAC